LLFGRKKAHIFGKIGALDPDPQTFHTLDPNQHQQIFQTLDPDPDTLEMDVDPKPWLCSYPIISYLI